MREPEDPTAWVIVEVPSYNGRKLSDLSEAEMETLSHTNAAMLNYFGRFGEEDMTIMDRLGMQMRCIRRFRNNQTR